MKIDNRTLSIWAFAVSFAYILSFLFEGQILYRILDTEKIDSSGYILMTITAHFLGQFTCGLFCKSPIAARKIKLISLGICFLMTVPFLFELTCVYTIALMIAGYFAGSAVAAWGYYLKAYTPKNERIKSCADVLIISNFIMIVINVISINLSTIVGLVMSMVCLAVGMLFIWKLPVAEQTGWMNPTSHSSLSLRKPMKVLFLFVAVITINSGLMYQVINPCFSQLTFLTSWYWAVPYIGALIVMRNLPVRLNRPAFLYAGMAMIMAAFLFFMIHRRSSVDYVLIDTLMLGACGILDLFWWSIIGEILEYAKNPTMVFGIGLSANVFGVLCGDVIGLGVTAAGLQEAQIAVIALCVVCVTLIILPPLNRQLTFLLKSHVYLSSYSELSIGAQKKAAAAIAPLDPLTERENEILQLVLEGKSNREISETSFVTENTVKTHLKSIFSKYGVGSRAELISLLLRSKDF